MFRDCQRQCALRTTNHEIFICQIEMATVQVHPISFLRAPKESPQDSVIVISGWITNIYLFILSFFFFNKTEQVHHAAPRSVLCAQHCVWVLIEAFGSAMRCYADQRGYLWLSVDQPGLAACCLWRIGWLYEEMSHHGFRRWPPRLPAVIFRCLLTEVSKPSQDGDRRKLSANGLCKQRRCV